MLVGTLQTNGSILRTSCKLRALQTFMCSAQVAFKLGSEFVLAAVEQKLITSIQSCKSAKQLCQIQSQIITNAIDSQTHQISSRFLARCLEMQQIGYARQVFNQLPSRRHTSLWNVMSRGYLQNDMYTAVTVSFRDMLREGVKPNRYTLPPVLKSCFKLLVVVPGKAVHCVALKIGCGSNMYVGTGLIELYSSAGHIRYAYRAFSDMVVRNVVSWTAMVDGYVANGDLASARRIFDLAPERDVVLWNRIITAYLESGDMLETLKLFNAMPGKDVIAFNTLLNGYARNGDVEGCEQLFEAMAERNIFSWNAIIKAYTCNGRFSEVLCTFTRMVSEVGEEANDATLVYVLTACARLCALEFGEWVHEYAKRRGYGSNIYVCNGLIDMYAKCGVVEHAIAVFEGMGKRDLITWNTIINALAVHGYGSDALHLFDEMRNAGERLDGITFVGVLCACSHMGLVKEGLDHFQSMSNKYLVEPQIEHYGCMVDLLSRSGLLELAMEFVHAMPMEPDGIIWTSLLAASRVHKKIELAELSLRKLIELDPGNPANYVMLSNVYGEARKWEDLARLKLAMRDTGVKKVPGWSSIATADSGAVVFYSYDERHSRTSEIYDALTGLTMLLRLPGYHESDLMEP